MLGFVEQMVRQAENGLDLKKLQALQTVRDTLMSSSLQVM